MARENIGVRLDAKTVLAIDAFAEAEALKTGYVITRARVVRRAITEWLAAQAKTPVVDLSPLVASTTKAILNTAGVSLAEVAPAQEKDHGLGNDLHR